MSEKVLILAIESSCDDTSAAIIEDGLLLSSVIASQEVHAKYGGVVPELASRAHQQNILPVVDIAFQQANRNINDLSAIAYTRGPGLLGSLLVGTSFAKGLSIALDKPLIEVNHLQGHVMAHYIHPSDEWLAATNISNTALYNPPPLPFICLLVSGGNSQIIKVSRNQHQHMPDMEIIGQTIDDAAGETFDKCAKMMGLPYPGGPIIDKFAAEGNPHAFVFSQPKVPNFDYSFSGLKTSFLYFLRDNLSSNPHFIEENLNDLCASLQHTIITILLKQLDRVVKKLGIKNIALSGGVSANNALRHSLQVYGNKSSCEIFLPLKVFTTDNAAMICQVGYYKFLDKQFGSIDAPPFVNTQI